jgi:hypothetical protein
MFNLSRRKLYLVLVVLLLAILTTVVHAAQLDVDTFDADAQTSAVGGSTCTSVGGTDMLGGARDIEVVRTSGASTVQADVDTSVPDSLAFSIGAGTRGTALIQLDGNDGSCALSFSPGLDESLNPYDGLTLFVQQVDLDGVVTMRVYTTATDFSEYSYVIPYAISSPGFEIYFPFDQFTPVGAGANFGSVDAIEIFLDGTTIDSLDMTIDFVASDFSRDYGDLPATYTNTLAIDNGARHRIGGVYFGPGVDSEVNGQESGDATGDDMNRTDDEGGVTISGGGTWGDGTASAVVDITRPPILSVICVVAWIDWDQDNVFESAATIGGVSELVYNNFLSTDGTINFTSPTLAAYGGTYPSTLNARFRIFRPFEPLFTTFGIPLDPFGCPSAFGGATPAQVTQLVFGDATDGEVEDYQLGFGPTAITLTNATTNNQATGLVLVLGLTAAGLVVTTFVLRRRQEAPTKA